MPIKVIVAIWEYLLAVWYELPWLNTREKLLGLSPSDKTNQTNLFYYAYYEISKLQQMLKNLYKNPLSVDAISIAYIINKHAETVCSRALVPLGPDAGIQALHESILAHEKLLKSLGNEPKNGAQSIQVVISNAMIDEAKKTIAAYEQSKRTSRTYSYAKNSVELDDYVGIKVTTCAATLCPSVR